MNYFEACSDPAVFDRTMLGERKANGSKNAVERAHEIVVDVLANHVVKPIDPENLAAMEAIMQKADDAFKARKAQE